MINTLSYHRIHQYVKELYFPNHINCKMLVCADCGSNSSLTISCNNKSYLPEKKNFSIRCHSCNDKYDSKFKKKYKVSPINYFFTKKGYSYYLKMEVKQ